MLDEWKKELNFEFNCNSETLIFDVSNFEEAQNEYNDIFKKYKRLDILVNNAGALFDNFVGMISKKEIEQTFSTNTNGVILVSDFSSYITGQVLGIDGGMIM